MHHGQSRRAKEIEDMGTFINFAEIVEKYAIGLIGLGGWTRPWPPMHILQSHSSLHWPRRRPNLKIACGSRFPPDADLFGRIGFLHIDLRLCGKMAVWQFVLKIQGRGCVGKRTPVRPKESMHSLASERVNTLSLFPLMTPITLYQVILISFRLFLMICCLLFLSSTLICSL